MLKHYLMVDLGTGNTRVLLVTSEGEILGIRAFQNTYYKDDLYDDAQYFLPEEWQEKILQAADEICRELPDVRIDAVSSAGARQTIVLFDKEGKAFYALPNIDNRGREFMGEICDRAEIYRKSGKWATEDFDAAKLMGLARKRPELYERIMKFTSLSEWIGAIFTGRIVIEPSQACETQLYDIHNLDWSSGLCKEYGISEVILPEIMNAGEKAGDILEIYKTRFHMAGDAVYIVGGADTQTAVLQTRMTTGDIAVVSGTTSPVVAKSEKALYDPWERVWVDVDLKAASYQIEMNPGVTGLNYQKFKNNFFGDVSYEELEKIYEKKTDFGCTASFSSLLFYDKTSLRNGGFFMRAPLRDGLDRFDFIWAVLADSVCATFEQYDHLRRITGNDTGMIRGCGGGFRSRALCRMLAALSGKDIYLEKNFEQATTVGLIRLCNEYYGEQTDTGSDPEIIRAMDYPLIQRYYVEWLRNRDAVNKVDKF